MHEIYRDFIEEKSINLEIGKAYYTHYKVITTYTNMRINFPCLFTRNRHKYFTLSQVLTTLTS